MVHELDRIGQAKNKPAPIVLKVNVSKIIQARNQRQPNVPAHFRLPQNGIYPAAETIFLTGGVGDVLTVESFFSDDQRQVLKTILYATNKQKYIQQLFEALPNYPNLKEHKVVWGDFSQFWCFSHKAECIDRVGHIPELERAEDWGIVPKFPMIHNGLFRYNNSSFLKHKLCDIKDFNLPQNYVVIAPFSTDKRIVNRDFNENDWRAILLWLRKWKMAGVVLNEGPEKCPNDGCLINLSNETTIIESVEILKNGKGYFGIDSWMSPLAAKLFDMPFLGIKSNNGHCYNNRHIYFSPKTQFNFLSSEISKLV